MKKNDKKEWKTTVKPLNDEGTKWEIIVHLGWNEETKIYERRYKWVYATKEREIQAATRKFVAEIEREQEARIYSQETLEEWLTYWLNDHVPVFHKWEKNTLDRAKRIVTKNIIPSIGHIPIAQLESSHITDFYVKLSKSGKKVKKKDSEGKLVKDSEDKTVPEWVGLSNRTIKYVHVILNQSLNDAVTKNKIPANPAKGLKLAKNKEKPHSKWVVLDDKQLWEFINKSEGHRDYALIYTAAFTGARESELFGLKKDKLFRAEKAIRVEEALHLDPDSPNGFEQRERTKNDTSTRTIPVTKDVIEVIERHIAKQEKSGIESDLIFTEPDGEPINRNNLGHRFSNLARKNGYPGMTFHHLRHSHATILLSDGANINEVAERLGHADPRITLAIYGHVLPGRMQSLAERFASLVRPAPPVPDPDQNKDNNTK